MPVHAVQVLPERRPGQVLGDGVQAGDEHAEPGRRHVKAIEGVCEEGAEGFRVGEEAGAGGGVGLHVAPERLERPAPVQLIFGEQPVYPAPSCLGVLGWRFNVIKKLQKKPPKSRISGERSSMTTAYG